MRVLFVAGADQRYGTYQMSKLLLESVPFLNNNIEYVVITQKQGPLNEWCDDRGIENYVFPYRYCVYHPTDSRLIGAVKHFVKYLLVTILNKRALNEIEKKDILKDIDLIHTNINRDMFGILVAKKHHIPSITYLREFSRTHFGLRPIYKNQISEMNKYSSVFIAISDVVKNDWIDYGLDEKKIKVIYDGVDTNKYIAKSSFRSADMPLRIIMCGAIYDGKGQKQILEAVIALRKKGYDINLDFYGAAADKDYLEKLKHLIAKSGLQKEIRFMGYKDNISEEICNYDVGVVCSKAEGFGLVSVEYLLSGLTVIASDTGANPEILKNGKYGIIYPFGDVNELSRLISIVYEKGNIEIKERNELVNYAKDNFSVKNTALKLIEAYYLVVADKSESERV